MWGESIKYKILSLTVDIFIYNENHEFILIQRKNPPFEGSWALPGGFVDYGETTEDAAIREAKEETSIDIESVELFGVYSEPDRDPRRHTVSIVYLAHGNFDDAKADDDANDIGVFSFDVLKEKELAFDHAKILSEVKEHLEKTDWFLNKFFQKNCKFFSIFQSTNNLFLLLFFTKFLQFFLIFRRFLPYF